MEDIDVATAATTATTKKRARATGDKPKRERKPKGLTGPGITIINNRFVCAYTGELITHAFVPDAVKEVAFANLPCAVAWVKASTAKDEEKATIISNMCTQAGQVLESVPELPEREALIGFGGERVFDEWFPDIQLWNAVTRKTGVDVATYTAARGTKGAKSKKVKPAAHGMVRGAHLIAAGGVFPRNIKAIDAPVHKAPAPPPTKTSSIVSTTWHPNANLFPTLPISTSTRPNNSQPSFTTTSLFPSSLEPKRDNPRPTSQPSLPFRKF
jgi:hypothetical protein